MQKAGLTRILFGVAAVAVAASALAGGRFQVRGAVELSLAVSEWMNTAIPASWAYSEWMPVLPFVPVGLSPLLQWVVVPSAALVFSRRLVLPRLAGRAVNRE